MPGRQNIRHIKRLELTFMAGNITQRAITSHISEDGLFIRTRYGLIPESILNIELYLPDGRLSKLKGRVKRSIRTPIATMKNGMGVELLEKDANYMNFLRLLNGVFENKADSLPGHIIIICSSCAIKNKVPRGKLSSNPRCGKCGTILKADGMI